MRRDRSTRYVSNDGARGEECPKTTATPHPLTDRVQRPLRSPPHHRSPKSRCPQQRRHGHRENRPHPISFTALARSQILELLPDSRFLPVITVGDTVTVSCQSGQRIWKAQDKVPVYAYQYLRSKVLDRWDTVTPHRRPGAGVEVGVILTACDGKNRVRLCSNRAIPWFNLVLG
jgi:hypothetical protein